MYLKLFLKYVESSSYWDCLICGRQSGVALQGFDNLNMCVLKRSLYSILRIYERFQPRMNYTIKEMFKTLQGEGAQAGRAAVFCRFSGCNLWSGREKDRHKAICQFCDTDFIGTDGEGGGKFRSADSLAAAISRTWGQTTEHRYVVFTGGEPLLQLDSKVVDAVHAEGFEIAIETNGTIHPPKGIDWICVSPKAGTLLKVREGSELKLVFPQPALMPETFVQLSFDNFFLQPMDGPNQAENIKLATDYCLSNARWRLSLQTHKMIGIP